MDKYEYRLKAEQIEKLAGKKDYETAAKIADTIDWRRVRSLDMLYVVSEVYEAMERYEDCMEILNIAYDRAPVGRMLLYKMTEIATKMHEFKEAINLYREFVKAAPHDQSRYILKYQIYRERGSSLEDQIQTLQEYKTHEYQERWAYELASLYAEAGMTEECVRECDELILWFSEGEYVTKAMELKMQYAPLTAAQQEKYDKAMQPEEEPHDYKKTEVAFHDDKFSTVNLQAELAANLDEILLDGDDGIDIPELPSDDEVKEEEPMEEVKTEESDDIELESLDLDIPEIEEPEEIPEIEESEEEPENIELESLDLDIPEMEEPEEIPEIEESEEEPENIELESLDLDIPEIEEPEDIPEIEKPEEKNPLEERLTEQLTIPDVLAEWDSKRAKTEAMLKANAEKEEARKAKAMQETAELLKLISGESEEIPEDVRKILNEIEEEKQAITPIVTEDDLPQNIEEDDEAGEMIVEEIGDKQPEEVKLSQKEQIPSGSKNTIRDLERSLAVQVTETAVKSGYLTREQARLFTYFATVKGMSKQLSSLLKGAEPSSHSNSSRGNLVITGPHGNGKTTLAIDIVRALQKDGRIEGRKLAKISGSKLNSKDAHEVLGKLKGGALIIESAGGLAEATLMALSLAMEGDTGGLLIILEGTSDEIQKIFRKNKNFASKFDYTVDVPIFSNDELVNFGKAYALENEYVFDEFAMLALYDKIGCKQTLDHDVSVAEVKEIIDQAIEHAEKGGFKSFFAKMTKQNVDEDGNHVLREQDFE
ncbi:hypothetical protein KFE18_02255 [Clostridiaceae bacterium Marseille-Q4143]|nr:hypothetical protein KFE18_02255 [Clostridiaceae bacterium Marseille-Q4143]